MTGGAQFQVLALGENYAGFTIYFYEAGTTTGKDVWVDEGKSTAVQTIRADSKGTATWYADGMYRMKVLDTDGVLLYDWDNVRANTYISHTNPSTLYSTLNEAISTIGSDETDLYITQQIVMDANLVVPSNIRLHIIKGGSINQIAFTLTINGQIDAGLYQIFDGTGAVTFGNNSVKEVYPQWWGAVGNGITDDTTAIQSAIGVGNLILIPPGTYKISSTGIYIPSNKTIIAYDATLKITGTKGLRIGESINQRNIEVKGLKILITAATQTAIELSNNSFELDFEDIYIVADTGVNASTIGVDITTSYINNFRNCYILNMANAVVFNANANSNNFFGCSLRATSSDTDSDYLIKSLGGANNKFIGGDIENAKYFLYTTSGENLVFEGVYFEAHNDGYGFHLNGGDVSFHKCYMSTVFSKIIGAGTYRYFYNSFYDPASQSSNGWPFIAYRADINANLTLKDNFVDTSVNANATLSRIVSGLGLPRWRNDAGIWATVTASIMHLDQSRIYDDSDNSMKHIFFDAFDTFIAGLHGYITWNPGSLADGAGETSSSITVTGAALGNFVLVSASYDLQGITCNAYVDAINSVKVRLQNETGGVIDLASGTWKVRVIK